MTAFGLWFDVEKKKDTTLFQQVKCLQMLWFDVEKKKDTTLCANGRARCSCGLM